MTESSNPADINKPDEEKTPNTFQIVLSVLAAGFGVQSSKNRERDFKHGNYKIYAIVGLVFTVLFLITMITIVNWVLAAQ